MTMRVLQVNGREWASSGINPSRFIGAKYSIPCLALWRAKGDKRPMLTLQLYFVTVWIRLPWHHYDKRKGYTVGPSWGAVWSTRWPLRAPLIYWGN